MAKFRCYFQAWHQTACFYSRSRLTQWKATSIFTLILSCFISFVMNGVSILEWMFGMVIKVACFGFLRQRGAICSSWWRSPQGSSSLSLMLHNGGHSDSLSPLEAPVVLASWRTAYFLVNGYFFLLQWWIKLVHFIFCCGQRNVVLFLWWGKTNCWQGNQLQAVDWIIH